MQTTANAITGTPVQVVDQLMSLLPELQNVGATYYKQEALLALNAVLPAMFAQRIPITTKTVASLLSDPQQLLVLGQDLPEGCAKVNLLEYLDRFSIVEGKVDAKLIQGVLGGLTARLALSNYP